MYPNLWFATLLLLAIVINSAIARFLLVDIADRNKNEVRKGRLRFCNITSETSIKNRNNTYSKLYSFSSLIFRSISSILLEGTGRALHLVDRSLELPKMAAPRSIMKPPMMMAAPTFIRGKINSSYNTSQ